MSDDTKGTILIVDDTPDSVSLVETILIEAGYEVSVATSGEKALDRISKITPDLILLDIMMPGIDGYETCRRLKEEESTRMIPIIFLSALTETFDKVKGFDLGAVDYLIKPIAPKELLARVQTHLRLRRQDLSLEYQNALLQDEITQRKLAEKALQRANEELETRVMERTADLTTSNEELLGEMEIRKQAEEALRDLYQIHEAVLNSIPVRVFWKDTNLVYLGCNSPFAYDAGYKKPEDIIGKDDYEMEWVELADQYRGDDRQVIESGKPKLLFEEPLKTLAGETMYLLTSKVPLRDARGEIVGVLGTYLDITDRKRAEEAIQTAVQLNQEIDTMSVNECMNFTLDEAERLTTSRIGFFHFVNPDERTIQLMTWSSETRKHCFIPKEPERNYPVSIAGVWVDCLRERKPVIHNDYASLPHKKGLPEGHTPVIRELVVPIFDDDKIVAIIGVGNKATNYDDRDIYVLILLAKNAWTLIRRKRVEEDLIMSREKYRSLVENIHAGVYQNKADEKGSFIWANQAMVAIFGYESLEEFLQIQIVDLYVNPEKRTKYLENLLINGFVRNYEIQMKKKDGTQIWVSVNSHIRYNPEGSIQWIEGILEDISEHYQIEELKWRAFTQIEKNIEQFSILNDEIRNPLSIILLIISDCDIPDRDIVLEQVTRIDHIIELLDRGYLESEKVSAYLRKHRREDFMDPDIQPIHDTIA